ncbi:MAG: PHP domain-containing protein [Sporolactobacillus sp.]|nr:PHP domain-containing protein [Sporolactobacillus sp.]
MPFDTHNHTEFSFDCHMKLSDALAAAESSGLGLILTEHYDLNEQDESGRTVAFPIDAYFDRYAPFRGSRLLLGIELGLDDRGDYIRHNEEIVENYPFDMVVGSVHNIQDYDICSDAKTNFLSKYDFFSRYLMYAEHTVNCNPYIDTFAHIDYPCRYIEYNDNVLRYEDFPLLVDNFLFALIHHDICLEINLRLIDQAAFRDGLESIVRRYRRLGGRYVTIGGDNHVPETIGVKYALGLQMARANDLIPVYFQERRRLIDD